MAAESSYLKQMAADPNVQLTEADVARFEAMDIPLGKLFCYGGCVIEAIQCVRGGGNAAECAARLLECVQRC